MRRAQTRALGQRQRGARSASERRNVGRCGVRRRGRRRTVLVASRRSGLKAVPEAAHGHDVARVGRVGLHLGAQPADVHVDEPAVAEVVVAPHLVEQALPAEHPARVLGQLAQQAELGLGEVQLVAGAQHLALVGDDLEVAEDQPGVAGG